MPRKHEYVYRKENGLCVDCKQKTEERNGNARCRKCLHVRTEWRRKNIKKCKENKICDSCDGKIEEHRINKMLCEKCSIIRSEKSTKRQKALLSIGLCSRCGLAIELERTGKTRCFNCETMKQLQKLERETKYMENSKCKRCGEIHKELSNVGSCLMCFIDLRASTHHLSADDLYDLLMKQDLMCAYTGEMIFYDVVGSVDHINPKANGGNNEISNIQWVSWDANQMKGTMRESVFLETIEKIYNHRIAPTKVQSKESPTDDDVNLYCGA